MLSYLFLSSFSVLGIFSHNSLSRRAELVPEGPSNMKLRIFSLSNGLSFVVR
jgi:hypothetical protein